MFSGHDDLMIIVGEIGVKRWKVKFEETITKEPNERRVKRDKSLIDK